ncbi:MAG: glycosyltransferase family 4 protein [Isosphaeraceae bacterium]
MARPRILMVSGNAPPVLDGVGDHTARLAAELARQRPGWRWLWLTRRPRWFLAPALRRGGVTLLRPSHSWSPRGRALAAAVARRTRPDVVHVQEQIHSFHETSAAPEIASAAGCPVVATLHEYHEELPSVIHTDALVRLSRVLISNDPKNAERCLTRTGRAVDHHWWSGATVAPPDTALRPAATPGLVVTFGFLSALKSLGLLHEALKRLRQAEPGVRWRLVGPFQPESIADHAALAERLAPDRDWIELTGAIVSPERLAETLCEGSVMALPFADGASLRRTTLHAGWALGLPVVTTPPDRPSDAILDGQNVLLVREPTADAWSEALGRALFDRDLAAGLSAGSLAAADRFSWRNLAARHIAVYESFLG